MMNCVSARQLRTFHRLQLAAHLSQKLADRLTGEAVGLPVTQVSVLAAINEIDHPTQRDVASALGVNESAVAAMVQRLRQQALIDRHRSSRDARAWELELTDTGHDSLRRAGTAFGELNQILEHQLDQARLEALTHDLNVLIDTFAAILERRTNPDRHRRLTAPPGRFPCPTFDARRPQRPPTSSPDALRAPGDASAGRCDSPHGRDLGACIRPAAGRARCRRGWRRRSSSCRAARGSGWVTAWTSRRWRCSAHPAYSELPPPAR